VAGPGRVSADDPLLGEIVQLCGYLPLAVRIAGALLRHRHVWNLRHLADLLHDQRRGLKALSDGERDLAGVFDLSYTSLGERHQLLLRHLGVVPGPDADVYAAAALLECGPQAATALLEELVDHNLLIAHAPGRYRLHDLIRLHARALAELAPSDERSTALERLLDYHQHTAGHAEALITPYRRDPPASPARWYAPRDSDAAWAWLRAERHNLLAARQHAAAQACHHRVIALTSALATLLRADGPATEAIALHAAAAAAAQFLGERSSRAHALIELGSARNMVGDFPGAASAVGDALDLYRSLADRRGQADALTRLGELRRVACDNAGAAGDLREALDLFREFGDCNGQAVALHRLGVLRQVTGDYAGAIRDQQQALRFFRDSGNRFGHAMALTFLGEARRRAGDTPGAARDLRDALELLGDAGERNGRAVALVYSGTVRRSSGDLPGAARDLEAALESFRRLGARHNEAGALNQYAAVVADGGDLPRALNLYQEALCLAREMGMPDEQALALEGIAGYHLHVGDTTTGRAHLRLAKKIFQHLGMRPDTERVRSQLADLATT
jgi:tetratricopeptide (TPR) repeat protein